MAEGSLSLSPQASAYLDARIADMLEITQHWPEEKRIAQIRKWMEWDYITAREIQLDYQA